VSTLIADKHQKTEQEIAIAWELIGIENQMSETHQSFIDSMVGLETANIKEGERELQ
jgi:hypothetical protein